MQSPSVLLTDLYELTMLQAYWAERMNGIAVFELFVRKLPPQRSFLVAAGLAQVIDYLRDMRFTEEDLAYLGKRGDSRRRFSSRCATCASPGDVDAMPEGTVCFPDEPHDPDHPRRCGRRSSSRAG